MTTDNKGIKHFARYASIYQHNTLLFHQLFFQRILYRHSKFCGTLRAHLLTQYVTVSPWKRHFAVRIEEVNTNNKSG